MIMGRPPVVLLPGMDGTGDLLSIIRQRLSATGPVEVIGYPTDQPLGYLQLEDHVVSKLPKAQCVLLGESFSGPIAIRIARRFPERVAGLILASSFARHPMPWWLAAFVVPLPPAWLPRWLLRATLLGREPVTVLAAPLGRTIAKVAPGVLARRLRKVLRVDVRAELAETRCPLLCLHGRGDRLVPPRFLRHVRQARPDARITLLDAPHMLLETRTDEAARIIERFIGAL
jgi:pimeloyl-[acyl-carrier protein] methyl ester esterase